MITLFAYNQPIETFGIYISQSHARLTENHPLYKTLIIIQHSAHELNMHII